MSQINVNEQIAQFRKMATDDPDNELGHFRLGKLLMEAGQYDEAIKSLRRTLELSPFSKAFELLARCLMHQQKTADAIQVLRDGIGVADERGDKMPREEMAKMLVELGEQPPAPVIKLTPKSSVPSGGFQCARPGCFASVPRQLPRPPMNDEIGKRIYESVCAECWDYWLRNVSIKVINEMRLDLSSERGQETYDQIMRETLGLT